MMDLRLTGVGVRRVGVALGLAAGLCGVFSLTPLDTTAMAQARGPVQRSVMGKVTDKGGTAIGGAVVYLEDQRTNAVKSAIADADGGFRFVQLTQNTDYLLWAKKDGKKSPNKTISSFDSRNEFVLNLKIDE